MKSCPITNDTDYCFKKIINSFPVPLIIAGVTTGEILYLNEQAKSLLRIDPNDNSKHYSTDFYATPSVRENFLDTIKKFNSIKDYEIELKDMLGIPFIAIVSSTIIEYQNQDAIFSALLDITARKKTEHELLYTAQHDSLTNVYNKKHLLCILKKELDRLNRYNNNLSFLMIDIDRFKEINEKYGYLAGDEVLTWICIILQSSLRQTDYLGRLGGEEFGIILTETAKVGALNLAERIAKTVEGKDYHQNDITIKLTISIGVTDVLPQDTGINILKKAYKNLLLARESGGNTVR